MTFVTVTVSIAMFYLENIQREPHHNIIDMNAFDRLQQVL